MVPSRSDTLQGLRPWPDGSEDVAGVLLEVGNKTRRSGCPKLPDVPGQDKINA